MPQPTLPPKPILCYVTDRRSLALATSSDAIPMLLHTIVSAAAAGVDWIQLREKDLCGGEAFDLARSAIDAIRSRASGTRIIVNDRVDVALAAGAGGVHLSENGFSVSDARRLAGRFSKDSGKPLDFLIGVSCHSLGSALGAARDGADYIYFSPIFHTPSKAFYGPPQGVERLRQICQAVQIPVIAIGGINLENVASCYAAGAAGAAAIRLFQDATDLSAIVAALRSSNPNS
ncbi:MAG: thiamine phosphate synthase [Acidobacteria bacterium]|nr:thiamine phosphate synthase [Acidobacteriota bacterium]MBS1866394.1 thiamine phosphate synthase [Acidobacteriota bacterium]